MMNDQNEYTDSINTNMNTQTAGKTNTDFSQPAQFQKPNQMPVKTGKGFCITSLVLGIVCCALPWLTVVAIGPAIVGIVFGALGIKQARSAGAPAGMGIAGLVLSIIAITIAFLFWALMGTLVALE